MRSSTMILAAAAAGTAIAVDTITSMYLPQFDPQPLYAKSIGGDSAATTYVLGCPVDAENEDCGLAVPMVLVSGPKTISWDTVSDVVYEDEGDFSYQQSIWCDLEGTTRAECTATMTGAILTNTFAQAGDGSMPTSMVTTITGAEIASAFRAVTIVTDTASIQRYGTDLNGDATSYAGAAAVETGVKSSSSASAEGTGMTTSKPALPTSTSAASSGSRTSAVEANASGVVSSVLPGFAVQVTGLGGFAAAAVGAVMAMAAL